MLNRGLHETQVRELIVVRYDRSRYFTKELLQVTSLAFLSRARAA